MVVVQFVRKKTWTVSDNTIVAESLGDFNKNLFKKGLNVSKKMAKNVLKNPVRVLEIAAKVSSAFASRRLKSVLSSQPEVMTFKQEKVITQ